MIASQQNNLSGESDFEGIEKADYLTALLPSVHVVAHEEVAGIL
jgi:hypothetical protein